MKKNNLANELKRNSAGQYDKLIMALSVVAYNVKEALEIETDINFYTDLTPTIEIDEDGRDVWRWNGVYLFEGKNFKGSAPFSVLQWKYKKQILHTFEVDGINYKNPALKWANGWHDVTEYLKKKILEEYTKSLDFDERVKYYEKRKEIIKMKQKAKNQDYIIRVIGDFKDGGELEDWGEMDFNSVEEAVKYLGMRKESIKEAEKALNGERDTFAGLVWKKISYRKGLK